MTSTNPSQKVTSKEKLVWTIFFLWSGCNILAYYFFGLEIAVVVSAIWMIGLSLKGLL